MVQSAIILAKYIQLYIYVNIVVRFQLIYSYENFHANRFV
jgi:hypothetical protein